MAGLDASIPMSGMNALAALPTPQQNMQGFLSTQNAIQANQANALSLAQTNRVQQSQQAINDAYKQNIDPNTGLIDSVGLANTIRDNPNVTVGADDAIKAATDQHIAQLNMTGDQMKVAQQSATIQSNSANAVLAQADKENRHIGMPDVINEAADAFNGGAWGDPKTQAAKDGMSKWIGSAPTDPTQLDGWMRRQAANGADAAAGLTRAITGKVGISAQPQGDVPYVQNQNNGATRTLSGGAAAGVSPTALITPVAGHDDQNRPTVTPLGAVATSAGIPQSTLQGSPVGGAPAAQAPVFTRGGGYPGPTAVNPTGTAAPTGNVPGSPAAGMDLGSSPPPAPTPPAAQASPYGGAVPMGPSAGRAAQMASGVSQYTAAMQAIPAEKASLNSAMLAYKGLVAAGSGGTGPGSQAVQTLKGYLAQVTQNPAMLQSNASYADLTKLLANNTAQQAAAFGPHTDAGLANAYSGNASTSISNLAAQDVMRTQIALQRARQLSALSYPGSAEANGDTTGSEFTAHDAKIATTIDPRATGYDMMTGAERQKLKDSMSPKQYDAFKQQVALAVKVGLVPPPGQQAATGFAPGQ